MAGAEGILGALRIIVDADTSSAQKALKSFGGRAQLFGAAAGAAVGGLGIAALKMGDQYDAAMDGIRAATGATGDEMSRLEGVTNSVAGHVTESLEEVASVVGIVQQKTGSASEATVESLVDLARLTETAYDAAATAVTDTYANWGVAAADQVAANDTLLRAYQASGVGIEELTGTLTKNGPVLRELGYSFEESAALVATLGKAGIDTNAVMGPLRKSLATLIKAGKDPKEAIAGIFDAIKNAPDDVKAGQLAMDTFGSKGATMAGLIRDGTLDIETMYATIADGSETVQGASDDTRDWADGIKELMNKLTSAVGPISSIFAGLSDSLGNAIYLLPAIGGFVGKQAGKLGQKFGGLFANATADAAAGPLRTALTKMMAKIGLEGAASSLATKFTGLLAAALPFVAVAGLGVAIGAMIGKAIVGPEAEAAMKAEGDKVASALAGADTLAELEQQRKVLEDGLARANAVPFANDLFGSSDHIRSQIEAIDARKAELVAAATKLPAATVNTAGAEATGTKVGTSMATGIKHGFHIATKAAIQGFGSVKDALAHPPKLHTKAWRLDRLGKQMKGVMSNLRKAVKAGDPINIQYWETARAKVEGQQRRLKHRTVSTMKDLRGVYDKTGTKVKGTWADIKNQTETKSEAASGIAIGEAQDTKTGIDAVNLRSSGIGLMTELANGIYAGIPQVHAASTAAAAAAAGPLRAYSPPKEGPLMSIDKWGGSLIDAWVDPMASRLGKVKATGDRIAGAFSPKPNLSALAMAGGTRGGGGAGGGRGGDHFHVGTLIADRKGLTELDRRMAGRRRIKSRHRRRVDSPNPQGT